MCRDCKPGVSLSLSLSGETQSRKGEKGESDVQGLPSLKSLYLSLSQEKRSHEMRSRRRAKEMCRDFQA